MLVCQFASYATCSFLQCVCFVMVVIVAQHQMVSPCASCRLPVCACSPSMLCDTECRSALKTHSFFVLGVRFQCVTAE